MSTPGWAKAPEGGPSAWHMAPLHVDEGTNGGRDGTESSSGSVVITGTGDRASGWGEVEEGRGGTHGNGTNAIKMNGYF